MIFAVVVMFVLVVVLSLAVLAHEKQIDKMKKGMIDPKLFFEYITRAAATAAKQAVAFEVIAAEINELKANRSVTPAKLPADG